MLLCGLVCLTHSSAAIVPADVRVPIVPLVALSVAVVALSAVAFGFALRRVSRLDVAPLLREQ